MKKTDHRDDRAMQAFTIMTRFWLPALALAALAAPVLPWPLAAGFPLGLLLTGYLLQARRLGLSASALTGRPANWITLLRLVALILGLSLLTLEYGGRLAPLLLIWTAFALDFFDGILARRFPSSPRDCEYGAWMDRESDAVALLLTGLYLYSSGTAGLPLLIIGLSRYVWGLVFLLIPLPMPGGRRFGLFSKAVAAYAQFAAAAAFAPQLLTAFDGTYLVILTGVLSWTAAALVTLSFLIEAHLRLELFRTAAGGGWYGLLRSFLLYYRLPLRFRRMRAFYSRFLTTGSLAFDIGAHLGNRIPPWRDLGARIIAVEPQPGCRELLSCWYEGSRECELVFTAVGEVPGRARVLICEGHPTLTTLEPEWTREVASDPRFAELRWNESEETEVVTLEQLRQEFGEPDFVKIDVEGFEAKVLAGAGPVPLKAVSFEFLPAACGAAFESINLLEQRGRYRYNFSWGEQMRFHFSDWLDAAGLVRFLRDAVAGGRSGDVYAELIKREA